MCFKIPDLSELCPTVCVIKVPDPSEVCVFKVSDLSELCSEVCVLRFLICLNSILKYVF
jgi:hypothetical protein